MPVTAKFSEQFYARLGHDVVEELIDWFNTVDTTYHTDLERLNELNFARFEAKLDQRAAELRSEIQRLEERMNGRFEAVIQQQRTALADLRAELIKWMFVFWVGTLGTLIVFLKFWV